MLQKLIYIQKGILSEYDRLIQLAREYDGKPLDDWVRAANSPTVYVAKTGSQYVNSDKHGRLKSYTRYNLYVTRIIDNVEYARALDNVLLFKYDVEFFRITDSTHHLQAEQLIEQLQQTRHQHQVELQKMEDDLLNGEYRLKQYQSCRQKATEIWQSFSKAFRHLHQH